MQERRQKYSTAFFVGPLLGDLTSITGGGLCVLAPLLALHPRQQYGQRKSGRNPIE